MKENQNIKKIFHCIADHTQKCYVQDKNKTKKIKSETC